MRVDLLAVPTRRPNHGMLRVSLAHPPSLDCLCVPQSMPDHGVRVPPAAA